MKDDELVKARVGNVTLLRPDWLDVGVPVVKQHAAKKQEDQPAKLISPEEQQTIVRILEYLRDEYSVGMTLLQRRVGKSSDLRSIFLSEQPVEYVLVIAIAKAIGVSVEDLYLIEDFSVEHEEQLKEHIKRVELIEKRVYGRKGKTL